MRVPKKDFQRFKNACERMCQLLGLQHYSRIYRQTCSPQDWAGMMVMEDGHTCVFTMTTILFTVDKEDYSGPELLAVHEVAHLSAEKMYYSAREKSKDKKYLDEEFENFARRFENMMLALLTPAQLKALGD